MSWKKYPESKPISSEMGAKKYYYVQLQDEWYGGYAYKCWYKNGHWLCDSFQSVLREVTYFMDAPKNGKQEIKLT